MVFENVAMYIDPQNGSQIKLRPLPTWLGIQPDPGAQAAETDWSTFYPLNDGLGYNVPNDFHAFIENHGGVGYSGYPITEYRLLQDGGYSQCFTNLCLEFHPTAPEQLQIRPHALGIDYQTNGDTSSIAGSSTADALQVNVSEEYPLVSSGQRQVINIQVSQRNTPVSNVAFSLSVKQPDGITKTYQLTPTGEGGTTRIELDPISGPNGSIIQYEVCIVEAVTPQICFTRDYTIWNQ
jgi:hypothetical protein